MGSIKGVSLGLAISDDLKNSVSVLNSANAFCLKAMTDYDTQWKILKDATASAGKAQDAQGKFTTLAEAKAKELGVDPSAVSGYNDSLKAWDVLEQTRERIKEFL